MIVLEGMLFNLIIFLLTVCLVTLGGELSERGIINPTVRRVRGLDSIEMAINRAKEMGRPILYAGIYSIRQSESVASLNILGWVARKAYEIDVPLLVGVGQSNVLPATRDVCQTSAYSIGKPEQYNPENVYWWSDSFVTYEQGLVELAEEFAPAAYFDFGWIQDENVVIPGYMMAQGIDCFCMAGCRQIQYTACSLIGTDDWLLSDELYAASAYASGTKESVGSIASSDWIKLIMWALIIIGGIGSFLGSNVLLNLIRM